MYEAHFQMHRRPFPPTADVSTYVGLGPVEQAGQTLLRVVARGSGPALVIGAAGTGKSMLCQLLAEHFDDQMMVALLSNGQLANPKALFQAILFELGLPYRDMDENELRLSLVEYLTDAKRCPQGLLLIVDEAHVLPLRILEEIRMLTNIVQNGQSRVHLVLAGGAALEERFTSPKLDSFNQRLAARCYLENLNREETGKYICEQVLAAGGNHETVFNNEALSAVFDATDGIPRLINQLCDHALIMAALGGHATVTADVIQEAWADLQQLPTPWNEPAASGSAGGQHVIEFGALDDDDAPASVPFMTTEEDATDEDIVETPAEVAVEAEVESQLDQIETHVAAAQETLEEETPAATSEPAEEVAPPEPTLAANPFDDDAFEEEIAVVDAYASLQETRLINAPRVSSSEGRQIAAMLASAAANTTPAVDNEAFVTTISVTESEDPEQNSVEDEVSQEVAAEVVAAKDDVAVAEEQATQRQLELTQAVASLLQDDDGGDVEEVAVEKSMVKQPIVAQPPVEDVFEETTEQTVTVELSPQESFEAHPQLTLVGSDAAAAPEDDRDLIIVEDPNDQTPATSHVAQGQARRQKYRQLFNRLRQA